MAEHHITEATLTAAGYRLLYAGDDYSYKITVTVGGSALVLTGATAWFTVKRTATDSDNRALLQLSSTDDTEIDFTGPTIGEMVIYFKPTNTAALAGLWVYDLQVKKSDGDVITVAQGNIEFLANTTKTTT